MRPSEARIGVDQQARRPAASAGARSCSQSASRAISATIDLALQVHGRGAGAVARTDLDAALGARSSSAAAAARPRAAARCLGVVERHGAQRVGRDPLGGLGDRLERVGQVHVAGDALEHASLADREELGALALGDVGDAAADQAPAGRGQAHQADFAGDVVTERVAVQSTRSTAPRPRARGRCSRATRRTTACRRPAPAG